jgi:hypothetical protein
MTRLSGYVTVAWQRLHQMWQQQVWPWYRARGRKLHVAIAAGALLLVCVCCGSGVGAFVTQPSSPTAAQQAGQYSPVVTRQPTHLAAPPKAATATPTAAPTATETPTPLSLTIAITCAQASDYASGHVCVHTAPGAALTITVTYCSGRPAKSSSLGPATADSAGNHTWTWTPQTNCKGQATADVSASLNGDYAVASQQFTVK